MVKSNDEVNILYLSDLHISDNITQPIYDFFISNLTNISYDLVLIAGDIIDCQANDYNFAKLFIDKILNTKNLGYKDLILVPGNHDKTDATKSERLDEILLNYSKSIKVNEEDVDFLNSLFSKFSNSIGDEYFSNFKRFDGFDTIGLKYFDDFKLCFVCINTEIPYIKGSHDRVLLFPTVISELYGNITKGYKVITLMHRNFEDIDWCSKNSTYSQESPVDIIINKSDMIFTGHSHFVRPIRPDILKVSTPLLKGGTFQMINKNIKSNQDKIVYENLNFSVVKINFNKNYFTRQLFFFDPLNDNPKFKNESQRWLHKNEEHYLLNPYIFFNEKQPPLNNDFLEKECLIFVQNGIKEEEIKAEILLRIFGINSIEEIDARISLYICDISRFEKIKIIKNKYINYTILYKSIKIEDLYSLQSKDFNFLKIEMMKIKNKYRSLTNSIFTLVFIILK